MSTPLHLSLSLWRKKKFFGTIRILDGRTLSGGKKAGEYPPPSLCTLLANWKLCTGTSVQVNFISIPHLSPYEGKKCSGRIRNSRPSEGVKRQRGIQPVFHLHSLETWVERFEEIHSFVISHFSLKVSFIYISKAKSYKLLSYCI